MSRVAAEVDVSVVVPTYRRPVELLEALVSALAQEGVSVEAIVIDDSPDGEAESVVANLNDSRLHYLRNPVPTGGNPGQVRNLGWPRARGRYLHFLDDDDRVPPGHYAQTIAEFAAHPDIGMVFGRIEVFGRDPATLAAEQAFFERSARLARLCQRLRSGRAFCAGLMFLDAMLNCGAAVVRRDSVAAVGGFNPEVVLCEDADFFARVARLHGAWFTDRVTSHYRIGESILHRPNVEPLIEQSFRKSHRAYRERWGRSDFLVMKAMAKSLALALSKSG